MSSYVLDFQDIDASKRLLVGGKAANLAELARIADIHVPTGFCVSTRAFQHIVAENPSLTPLLEKLSSLTVHDYDTVSQLSNTIREAIEAIPIPQDLQTEIVHHLSTLGEHEAYAVRSSATAEDLPDASFAGQQDTYLNILGPEDILSHIRKCWSSLFTTRAITYRIQNGFDHHNVLLAVIVQRMLFPQVAGILFTADPITSNRKVLSIDASFGLGEALVSGLVNADTYKVRDGEIIEKKIATKKLAISALPHGGTQHQEIELARQQIQALTDEQILQLAHIGRKVQSHFGYPQDIEWTLSNDTFSLVQSRPITTLYPIPQTNDQAYHVYLSVGHQQMMTDAIRPLGISFRQLTAARPFFEAGARLFVDITTQLSSPASQKMLLTAMRQHDPLIEDAVQTIIERGNFPQPLPEEQPPSDQDQAAPLVHFHSLIENDPAIVPALMQKSQASIAQAQQTIQSKTGLAAFDSISQDIQQLKALLMDPQSTPVFMTAINASIWLNTNIQQWLGEQNVADILTQSVPNNITSEMGLALMDVADVIRPYPAVIAYLQQLPQTPHDEDDTLLTDLLKLPGGQETHDALSAFLAKYGMRCVGEIDITRPRWSEQPSILVPTLLSNIKNFTPGASTRKFTQGLQDAQQKEQQIIDRLRQLPDGTAKSTETQRVISLMRNFIGYREYPKYAMICRLFIYRKALLREITKLVQTGVLHTIEESYYLTFEELREVVRTQTVDYRLIDQREKEFARYEKLTAPRVLTSDGEIVAGTYKRAHLPAHALIGLPVSAGVVEGRARVLLSIDDATLEEGDILVTPFTDPSWTPLFVSIKALVTEIGGLMTHGVVIAREYGLPAVIGVEHATTLIHDGQRIRVNGTEGYVEILP
jgi:rifampicin phosphotransferase